PLNAMAAAMAMEISAIRSFISPPHPSCSDLGYHNPVSFTVSYLSSLLFLAKACDLRHTRM
ncbi:MAG TPA: hypothetical protein VGL41_04595, partial [Roseiarcus sp.]